MSEWISVKDRLPECNQADKTWTFATTSEKVLCVIKQRDGKVFVKEGRLLMWNGEPRWKISGTIYKVTHWQPLPEPPEERDF